MIFLTNGIATIKLYLRRSVHQHQLYWTIFEASFNRYGKQNRGAMYKIIELNNVMHIVRKFSIQNVTNYQDTKSQKFHEDHFVSLCVFGPLWFKKLIW